MPSVVIGFVSGGQLLVSGNYASGQGYSPEGGVQIKADRSNSGSVYVALSGGVTVTSGGLFTSGGGRMDGMQLAPGDAYWAPRIGITNSGALNIYVGCDAACSGQARVYYEVF